MATFIRHKFILFLVALVFLPFGAGAVIVDGIAYRFNDDGAVVIAHAGYKGVVEIPDTVTLFDKPFPVIGIDDYAFYDCDNIYSVFMPQTLQFIGKAAFAHCDSIISMTVPDRVEQIPDSAFAYCPNLEVTILGRGVSSIGHGAFWYAGSGLLSCPRLVILSDMPPEVDAELVEYMLMDSPFSYILFIYAYDQISGTNWQKFLDYSNSRGRTGFAQCADKSYGSYIYPADRDYLDTTEGTDLFRLRHDENGLPTDWLSYAEHMSNWHYNYTQNMIVKVLPELEWYYSMRNPTIRGEYYASISTNNNAFTKAKIPMLYAEAIKYFTPSNATYEMLVDAGTFHLHRATGREDSTRFVVIYKNHYHILHNIYSDSSTSEHDYQELFYTKEYLNPVHSYCLEHKLQDTISVPIGRITKIFSYLSRRPNYAVTFDNRQVLYGYAVHDGSNTNALCHISGIKSGIAHIYLYPSYGTLPKRTITVIVGDGESGIEQEPREESWQAKGGIGQISIFGLKVGAEYEIYNINGQVVRHCVAPGNQVVVDGLQPGAYIIRHMAKSVKALVR